MYGEIKRKYRSSFQFKNTNYNYHRKHFWINTSREILTDAGVLYPKRIYTSIQSESPFCPVWTAR